VLVLGEKMKPFDLEAAKRGEPILYASMDCRTFAPAHFIGVTEDGVPVIQWAKHIFAQSESELRMAPKKRTVYVNVYQSRLRTTRNHGNCSAAFDTEEGARDSARGNGVPVLAVAVPIEIEE
jgi:hypothetical protein